MYVVKNVRIELDDLAREPVRDLIAEHLGDMFATTPPESVHALGLEGLEEEGVSVWSAWDAGTLLGVVALSAIDERHAEIKSMRTTRAARRRGIATLLLEHVLTQARNQGYERLSLETGSEEYFAPARALYERHGFEPCPPFADYREDPLSVYLTRAL